MREEIPAYPVRGLAGGSADLAPPPAITPDEVLRLALNPSSTPAGRSIWPDERQKVLLS